MAIPITLMLWHCHNTANTLLYAVDIRHYTYHNTISYYTATPRLMNVIYTFIINSYAIGIALYVAKTPSSPVSSLIRMLIRL